MDDHNKDNELGFYNAGEKGYAFTNFYGPGSGTDPDIPAPIFKSGQVGHPTKSGEYLFRYLGINYRTSEELYQANKFGHKLELLNEILSIDGTKNQFDRAKELNDHVHSQWHETQESGLLLKEEVMLKALCAKYVQNDYLENLLLETGNEYLAEHSTQGDHYWGALPEGKDQGPGQNRLGIMLTELREALRNTTELTGPAREQAIYTAVAANLSRFPPLLDQNAPRPTEPPYKTQYMAANLTRSQGKENTAILPSPAPVTPLFFEPLTYHPDGEEGLKGVTRDEYVLVFGSNEMGLHSGGMAAVAEEKFGAVKGESVGMTGSAYAIPTMSRPGGPKDALDIEVIKKDVEGFIKHAKENPDQKFYMSRIGGVIAGFSNEQIAPMFVNVPSNCFMPEPWREIINRERIAAAQKGGFDYKPDLPPAVNLQPQSSQGQLTTEYPDWFQQKYTKDTQGGFYKKNVDPQSPTPAFVEQDNQLEVLDKSEEVAKDVVALAKARGADSITVGGPGVTQEIAAMYWKQAKLQGLDANVTTADGQPFLPSAALLKELERDFEAIAEQVKREEQVKPPEPDLSSIQVTPEVSTPSPLDYEEVIAASVSSDVVVEKIKSAVTNLDATGEEFKAFETIHNDFKADLEQKSPLLTKEQVLQDLDTSIEKFRKGLEAQAKAIGLTEFDEQFNSKENFKKFLEDSLHQSPGNPPSPEFVQEVYAAYTLALQGAKKIINTIAQKEGPHGENVADSSKALSKFDGELNKLISTNSTSDPKTLLANHLEALRNDLHQITTKAGLAELTQQLDTKEHFDKFNQQAAPYKAAAPVYHSSMAAFEIIKTAIGTDASSPDKSKAFNAITETFKNDIYALYLNGNSIDEPEQKLEAFKETLRADLNVELNKIGVVQFSSNLDTKENFETFLQKALLPPVPDSLSPEATQFLEKNNTKLSAEAISAVRTMDEALDKSTLTPEEKTAQWELLASKVTGDMSQEQASQVVELHAKSVVADDTLSPPPSELSTEAIKFIEEHKDKLDEATISAVKTLDEKLRNQSTIEGLESKAGQNTRLAWTFLNNEVKQNEGNKTTMVEGIERSIDYLNVKIEKEIIENELGPLTPNTKVTESDLVLPPSLPEVKVNADSSPLAYSIDDSELAEELKEQLKARSKQLNAKIDALKAKSATLGEIKTEINNHLNDTAEFVVVAKAVGALGFMNTNIHPVSAANENQALSGTVVYKNKNMGDAYVVPNADPKTHHVARPVRVSLAQQNRMRVDLKLGNIVDGLTVGVKRGEASTVQDTVTPKPTVVKKPKAPGLP